MPIYMISTPLGVIRHEDKPSIAAAIVRTHCDVTGEPAKYVHCFFFDDVASPHLNSSSMLLFGNIRSGRTPGEKATLIRHLKQAVNAAGGVPTDGISASVDEIPAAWVMSGGELLAKP